MATQYDDEALDLEKITSTGFDWTHPAETLKILGHPLRLQIVAVLCGGSTHVSGLIERLGVRQSTISQHLRLLRMNGVVEGTRVNGYMVYRLIQPRIPELLRCIVGCSKQSDTSN